MTNSEMKEQEDQKYIPDLNAVESNKETIEKLIRTWLLYE